MYQFGDLIKLMQDCGPIWYNEVFKEIIDDYIVKEQFVKLIEKYNTKKTIYPPFENMFKQFQQCSLYDISVVIFGYKPIQKPTYDFVQHNRSKNTQLINPTKIILTEGILVLEDERIRDIATIKIFVESDDDIRFIRRLVRDTKERGRSIDSVINQYLTTVKPMYYSFVKPTKRYADMIIPNDNTHDVAVLCITRMINDMLKEEK